MGIDRASNEWMFFKRSGPWLRQSQFLRNFNRDLIIRENNAYPGFVGRLRELALDILTEKGDFNNLQLALSVLSVVGNESDISLIKSLDNFGNEDLSVDIKTCVYEIRHGSN